MKSVYWERVVSVSVAPAPPNLRAVYAYYDPDDEGNNYTAELPVVGLEAAVVESYWRCRRGEDDHGAPDRPPTARTLASEGYRFSDRGERHSVLVLLDGNVVRHDDRGRLHDPNIESIAVIGPGDDPAKVGRQLIRNLCQRNATLRRVAEKETAANADGSLIDLTRELANSLPERPTP